MQVQEHPRWTQIQRVHVIGGPGTGKTTLSYQLADILDVPLFELDEIAGAGPAPAFRMQRPLTRRLADVGRIASQPGWITEGSFLWWTNELLRSADIIIWLDIAPRLAMRRVLARHTRDHATIVLRRNRLREKLAGLRHPHLRHLLAFVSYTWAYYHRDGTAAPPTAGELDDGWALSRSATERQLAAYADKVIRCTYPADVTNLLRSIMTSRSIQDQEAPLPMDKRIMDVDTGPMRIVSAYAELHKADWIPTNYDENIYNPDGYDSFVWDLYRQSLVRIVQDIVRKHDHVKYLDFACGTGRIIAVLEQLTTEAVGLDISPQMIAAARRKVSRGVLRCGDILAEPHVVDSDYDLITAFRFFLNTEPEMRRLVMRSLASRLADQDSRLIFNVHINGWGINGLKSLYRRLRGWGPATTMIYPQVRRLVEDAGLVIENWYGFALWPDRAYRGRLSPLCKGLDRLAVRVRPLRWISKDMLFVCRPQARGRPNGTGGKPTARG